MRRYEFRPAALRRAIHGVARLLPHASPGRNRLLDYGRTLRGRYAATVATALSDREGGVARAHLAQTVGSLDELLRPWFDQAAGQDFASQMMIVDSMTYLPGDIMTKVDRMSMAVSLEARVPLLDHRLAEFAFALPSHFKMRQGVGKWILRQAIEPLVPPAVLRKPKQGFGVPLNRWFRNELRHRVDSLLRPDAAIYEHVAPDAVRRLAREHQSGRRDHSHALWKLLALELWFGCLRRGELAKPTTTGDSLRSIVRQAKAS
jgi:asparagine synthase (glutamine-hydrolysing)